jgi:hypothetical protein
MYLELYCFTNMNEILKPGVGQCKNGIYQKAKADVDVASRDGTCHMPDHNDPCNKRCDLLQLYIVCQPTHVEASSDQGQTHGNLATATRTYPGISGGATLPVDGYGEGFVMTLQSIDRS